MLSAIQMLRHIGEKQAAERFESALLATFTDGVKTKDLGGHARTAEFANAIIERLNAGATASA
jgi:isocitrate/isopropylmalate dehydrogenase